MALTGVANWMLRMGGFAYLLLFSTLCVAPSLSLNDKRNGPIRLRENLWATGHFMGKKSVLGSSPGQEDPDSIPETIRPVLKDALEDVKDLLTGELLKILLQEKLLEENQEKHDLKEQ
uniref:Uncharacterized protein n=1 Tax=Salvator merianae TaxID=96440 RepID=A0A8D0BPK1_SALMN